MSTAGMISGRQTILVEYIVMSEIFQDLYPQVCKDREIAEIVEQVILLRLFDSPL